MKRLKDLGMVILVVLMMFPLWSVHAQTPTKAKLPQVPITYPADTNETVIRRAQWIEEAKKEGELIWWGTASPAQGSKIIAEFNKAYPFIKVNYWRGRGEEIASKLEIEFTAGRRSVDVALGGEPYNYPRWRKTGMIGRFTEIMPGIKSMDKRMYSIYGDWASSGNSVITPQYNTKLVSAAEAPKSWEDLLDPKWKAQLGLTTDMKGWTTLALEEGGWGIEKTENFLKRLKQQQPIWGQAHTAGHNLLIAGEFKIFGEDYLHHIFESVKKGAPVDWVRVKPVAITGSSFTLMKNAPHPNAAKLFLEWQFSPQGLGVFEAVTGKGAAFPGSGTRLAKALEGMLLVVRTEEGEMKSVEIGLDKRFADILGVTSGGD